MAEVELTTEDEIIIARTENTPELMDAIGQ
jgi:hypothetical protein